jgi:hypothetical protein
MYLMSTEKSCGVDSLDSLEENEARNPASIAVPRLPLPQPFPLPLARESRQSQNRHDIRAQPAGKCATSSSRAASEQQGYVPQGQISRIAAVRPRFAVLLVPLTQSIEIREQLKVAIADAPAPSASEHFLSLL